MPGESIPAKSGLQGHHLAGSMKSPISGNYAYEDQIPGKHQSGTHLGTILSLGFGAHLEPLLLLLLLYRTQAVIELEVETFHLAVHAGN